MKQEKEGSGGLFKKEEEDEGHRKINRTWKKTTSHKYCNQSGTHMLAI